MIPVEIIQDKIKDATSLDAIQSEVVAILQELKTRGAIRIGYVAGLIASDGPENVEANLERLFQWTELVSRMVDFPVLSAALVFNQGVYQRIGIDGLPYAESSERFKTFWRGILPAGVTDIFMTPGWEKSNGARDEHKIAPSLGITLHYIEGRLP